MTSDQAFLDAILQKPTDTVTKLVYADWLDDQGDLRGEYLRLLVEFDATQEQTRRQLLREYLFELRDDLLEEWAQTIDRTRLLTNGLYRANEPRLFDEDKDEPFWSYLRFYRDGAVLTVTSCGSPSEVWRWFHKDFEDVSEGIFHLRVDELRFPTVCSMGQVDYYGSVVSPRMITLQYYSHINGYREDQEQIYHFAELPA